MVKEACEKLQNIVYYNTFFKTMTQTAINLTKKLAEITNAGLNHIFLVTLVLRKMISQ